MFKLQKYKKKSNYDFFKPFVVLLTNLGLSPCRSIGRLGLKPERQRRRRNIAHRCQTVIATPWH